MRSRSPSTRGCPRPDRTTTPRPGETAMVKLDHSFENGRPVDQNWGAILDLDRLIPCVQGGRVVERTSPTSAKAEIKVKMGAMSMTFAGTVDVAETDEGSHTAIL